eukprot:364612-Chlamydomonas_euryale.AAC.29
MNACASAGVAMSTFCSPVACHGLSATCSQPLGLRSHLLTCYLHACLQAGYGEFQVTQKQGERADMYRMHLKPAMTRGNLKVRAAGVASGC